MKLQTMVVALLAQLISYAAHSAADNKATFAQYMQNELGRDYASYLTRAKRISAQTKATKYKLTEPEMVAVYSYTVDLYREINPALRAGGDQAKRVGLYVETLKSALKKLPATKGHVIRATRLPASVATAYKPGAIVSDTAFTSASATVIAEGRYKMSIESKTGRLIAMLSALPKEGEVLFPPQTRFRVVKAQKQSNGEMHYALEELE